MPTDFTSPPVKRGRITNARTGNFLTFLFNPVTVNDAKGINLIEDPTPGFAHPQIGFASGKPRIITFKLQICGESRLRRSGANLLNGVRGEPPQAALGFSIAGELDFLRSFEHPVDPQLPNSTGGLDLALFSYGARYKAVPGYLESVIEETERDPDLAPTRANVSCTLHVVLNENEFADRVWSPPVEGFGK